LLNKEHRRQYCDITDDTQLHLSSKPDGQVSQDVGVRALERCIADIRSCMFYELFHINFTSMMALC